MYISLNWIQDLISVRDLTLDELVNRLTLAGFEIESIEKKNNFGIQDFVLDISLTANRSDVSTIRGLIDEIIILFDSTLSLKSKGNTKPLILLNQQFENFNYKKGLYSQNINFTSLLNNYKSFGLSLLCQHNYNVWEWYLQRKSFSKIVQNLSCHKNSNTSYEAQNYITLFNSISSKIEVTESPIWIKKRLISMGFNPVNNVLDIMHYLMVETGQVFFAYDIDAIKKLTKSSNFIFIPEYATNECKFPLSESKIVTLNNNILTLSINKQVISIAGVMQHFATLINNKTSKLLVQVALYQPSIIKKSSKTLGLKTDYSIRLEKQIDLNVLEQSYLRLKHLFWTQNIKLEESIVEKNASNLLSNNFFLFSKYNKQKYNKKVKLSYQNIIKLTGPLINTLDLNNFHIRKTLKLLNFKLDFITDKNCYVSIPLPRQLDIEREIDIIEEIIRVIGFNQFKAIKIDQSQFGYLTKIEKMKRILRTYFLSLGFYESIQGTLVKSNLPDKIKLKNPIYNESSILRVSLLDSLIEKVTLNKKNIGDFFETFELGRIYKSSKNSKKKEIEVVSGVFGGNLFCSEWGHKKTSLSWFEAKGLIENLLETLNISSLVDWKPIYSHNSKFHPNRTTELFIGNKKLGLFGQIHPNLALKHDLEMKLYLFELNTEILNSFSIKKNLINYIPYSSYPISYIDLSFLVNKSISAEEVQRIISQFGQPLLKNIALVDYYYKEPIKKGYCSLTFKLKFQSEIRTLSNEEVTEIINPIITYLEKHYDIKVQE